MWLLTTADSRVQTVLLPFGLGRLRRQPYAGEASDIFGDAAIERLGDLLPVVRPLQLALVVRVGDEADLGEDRRHVGADQHHEGRLLHATVARAAALGVQAGVKRRLHVRGEFLAFIDLVCERELLYQVL